MRIVWPTLLLALVGCASRCPESNCVTWVPLVQATRTASSTALLFDRCPGQVPAEAFAVRSDWPSTTSFYSPGEVITYREYLNDFQGRGLDPDWTYRRFQMYRSGVGYR